MPHPALFVLLSAKKIKLQDKSFCYFRDWNNRLFETISADQVTPVNSNFTYDQ